MKDELKDGAKQGYQKGRTDAARWFANPANRRTANLILATVVLVVVYLIARAFM